MVAQLLLALALAAACGCSGAGAAHASPESAGLVGTSPDKPTLPFKLWARSPKSAIKPRRRDLREAELVRQLGPDLDPRWMRTDAHPEQDLPDGPRQSVLRLSALASREVLQLEAALQLEPGLRERLRQWLVRRATCPVRYHWTDLGPYFWPRWVRRGQCVNAPAYAADDTPTTTASTTITTTTAATAGAGSEAAPRASCSWPPGLYCVPSAAKVLHLLRWHCRLRKGALSNSVWLQPAERQMQPQRQRRRGRRKRFRCQWLRVPYPVPEDCTCA